MSVASCKADVYTLFSVSGFSLDCLSLCLGARQVNMLAGGFSGAADVPVSAVVIGPHDD